MLPPRLAYHSADRLKRLSTACLASLASVLATGCQTQAPNPADPVSELLSATSGFVQSAYRIRAHDHAPLNGMGNWASPINYPATVSADQPFRIRFEVEGQSTTTNEESFSMEFRRNGGPWVALKAENFPQPAKIYEMEYEELPEGSLASLWAIPTKGSPKFSWQGSEGPGHLTLESGSKSSVAVMKKQTHWQATEFAVKMCLPREGTGAAGVIFAYENTENYLRADLDVDHGIKLVQVKSGRTAILSSHRMTLERGHWFELKLATKGQKLTLEYDDGGAVIEQGLAQPLQAMGPGIYLPPQGSIHISSITIEGEPASPMTSIISSQSFDHGSATQDQLKGSALPFTGGSGISFSRTTTTWKGSGQSEWEFPIVIRRFSDEAALSKTGDRFDYRMVDSKGRPLMAEMIASVIVKVPDGHLGGTFVETPMRLGPWQAANHDLYFLMEPAETWNALMVVRSSDYGRSWQDLDGANRPATGDLEGFASAYVNGIIHMVHQTSDDVWYHAFHTSDHQQNPNVWAIVDERIASPAEPPTQVADIAVRGDGSIVTVYGGRNRLFFSVRNFKGEWSGPKVIEGAPSVVLSGPSLVLGRNDVVHLTYTSNDGSAWYRHISPENRLSPPSLISEGLGKDEDAVGSILPVVYVPETDTMSVIYRLSNGQLWERQLDISQGAWSAPTCVTPATVIQNAVDSDQTGADAIVHRGSVHVLYIDSSDKKLYHAMRSWGGQWSTPKLCGEDHPVQWVRGAVIKRADGSEAYGYVIDAGSFGGSGMNRYREQALKSD